MKYQPQACWLCYCKYFMVLKCGECCAIKQCWVHLVALSHPAWRLMVRQTSRLAVKEKIMLTLAAGLQKDRISTTAYLSVSPSTPTHPPPHSTNLFVFHPLPLSLTGGAYPIPQQLALILFLPSSLLPRLRPTLLPTHSHPLLSHILPSSGPERWRCAPISF